MSDDPFKNRPEDFLNKAIRVGVGSLPVVGGGLNEFLAFVIGNPASERRDDFMKETFARVVDLESKYEKLNRESLRDNEQFQATFVQGVRLATTTASAQKKKLLQNAILNSAIINIDEHIRQMFMQVLDEVSPIHVVILDFLANPRASAAAVTAAKGLMAGSFTHIIEAALPDLTANKEVFSRVLVDLNRLGLADTGSVNVTMSGGDSMLTSRATSFGRSFLSFVAEPEGA